MATGFNFYAPHTFGPGTAKEAGPLMKRFGATRVLVICDPNIYQLGVVTPVIESIEAAGLEAIVWPHVAPDPHEEDIIAGVEFANESGFDGIIGIGGGSSIDTAKAVNFISANGGMPTDYLSYKVGRATTKVPLKPSIWIPTTSGTGSEVTVMAVFDDGVHKSSIVCPQNLPNMAIIDPELMVGMPPRVTATTGLDAFSHAAESMTGKMSTPFTEAWSREAIRLISGAIVKAYENGSDLAARTDMAYGSALAGFTFTNAMCHIGHAVGHATGKVLNIPHGEAIGQVLPYALRMAAGGVPDKVKAIGEILGVTFTGGETPEEIGQKVFDCLYALKEKLGIRKLRTFVTSEGQLEDAIDETLKQSTMKYVPVECTREDVSRIIYEMYNEK